MIKPSSAVKPPVIAFKYHSLRNISAPEDLANDRKVLCGHAPITSIVGLPTDENVREYLPAAEGRKRRKLTSVHRAILDTLKDYSDKFSILNGGIVIVARSYEVDEGNKIVKLVQPSIINGAQTQGVIDDYFEEMKGSGDTPPEIHVTFELIVTSDDDLIAEIAIARNFQNDVMTLSIAGRLGQLDELEQALQDKQPGQKLRKSETQLSTDYLATERLLQTIAALVPHELILDGRDPSKVYAYTSKAKCLKDFQILYEIVKGKREPDKNIPLQKYKDLYQFHLDIAAQAQSLHDKWKKHQGFKGTGIKGKEGKGIKRDDSGNIVEIADGIIFPILAALSAFAVKTKNGWIITPPSVFRDEELINTAKTVFMEIAGSDPPQMGKSKACYSALYQIAAIYRKLSND